MDVDAVEERLAVALAVQHLEFRGVEIAVRSVGAERQEVAGTRRARAEVRFDRGVENDPYPAMTLPLGLATRGPTA